MMMVCLPQHFFSLFYDYFQTSLNNSIGMPQFSSQTRTSSLFSPFLSKQFRIHWLPGTVRSCTRAPEFQSRAPPAAQGPDAAQKFHCCEFVSVLGTGRSPFLPAAFLRSCLMLPGKATVYDTGDMSSFFTHRPALPDPALPHTALPQSLPALPLEGPILPWKTRPRCSGCPQGIQAELVTSLALHHP